MTSCVAVLSPISGNRPSTSRLRLNFNNDFLDVYLRATVMLSRVSRAHMSLRSSVRRFIVDSTASAADVTSGSVVDTLRHERHEHLQRVRQGHCDGTLKITV